MPEATTAAADTGAASQAAAANAAQQQTSTAAAPWHQGVEAEIVGHWQNKFGDIGDAKKIAVEVTKQYRELEKYRGIPLDEIARLPKPTSPVEEVKAFYERLGAPKDAKDYDFAEAKFTNGEPMVDGDLATIREYAARNHLSKDAALDMAKTLVKMREAAEAEEAAEFTSRLGAENAKLRQNWGEGANYERNLHYAKEGARLLGFKEEHVTALESITGKAAIMEALRRVGAMGKEATFIEGGGAGAGTVTREGAQARMNDLKADKAWVQRWQNGGVAERSEMHRLSQIISGQYEAA